MQTFGGRVYVVCLSLYLFAFSLYKTVYSISVDMLANYCWMNLGLFTKCFKDAKQFRQPPMENGRTHAHRFMCAYLCRNIIWFMSVKIYFLLVLCYTFQPPIFPFPFSSYDLQLRCHSLNVYMRLSPVFFIVSGPVCKLSWWGLQQTRQWRSYN